MNQATTLSQIRSEAARKISIPFSWLRLCALLYILLPACVFIGGWLKWFIAIPAIAMLAWGLHATLKETPRQAGSRSVLALPYLTVVIVAILALSWSFLAGQGGFFYQSTDHHSRNAIFRDLINHAWPVKYPFYNTAMVYYIAHWLIPAIIGKSGALIGGAHFGWLVGNAALYLWTSLGLFLVILLLLHTVEASNKLAITVSLACLVFFSGLDVVGHLPALADLAHFPNHLEWWAGNYQYSSNTTLVFWVFNQALAAWLVTLLFLNGENFKNYLFLGLALLPSSPLPFVGLAMLLGVLAGKEFYGRKTLEHRLNLIRALLSRQNIMALVTFIPIFGLYYMGNTSAANQGFRLDWALLQGSPRIIFLLIFCLLEFGIFAIILFPKHKNDPCFLAAICSLLIIPVFKVGMSIDFSMRASIPALFVLMVYTIRHLVNTIQFENKGLKMPISTGILIAALLIGSITPVVEYRRAIGAVIGAGRLDLVADMYKTFDKMDPSFVGKHMQASNYLVVNPSSTIFFKYLAR